MQSVYFALSSRQKEMEVLCNYTSNIFQGWFTFGRSEGFPTRYSDHFSPAHTDVLTSGLILAFVILTFCLLLTIPGVRPSERWCKCLCIIGSLFIGGVVVVGNFGHDWETGSVKITTPYKAGSAEEVKASLGLHVALRGINITLKANAKDLAGLHDLQNETIDYNEHFSWDSRQGRFGFGPYAGQIAREFRAATLRGVPFPILQVAEYFTFDGEGIRFGRHYRLAGYYSYIMMWAAFPTWLLANILMCSTIDGGSLFLFLTGLLQLIAIAIWTFLRNPIELHIPFESEDGKSLAILSTKFGYDYYMVLSNGVYCVFLSAVIYLLNAIIPDQVCKFFGLDPSTNFDEYYEHHEKKMSRVLIPKFPSRDFDKEPGGSLPKKPGEDTFSGLLTPDYSIMRRKTTNLSVRIKKLSSSLMVKPEAKPRKRMDVENPRGNQKATPTEASEMSRLLPQAPRVEVDEASDSDYINIEDVKPYKASNM